MTGGTVSFGRRPLARVFRRLFRNAFVRRKQPCVRIPISIGRTDRHSRTGLKGRNLDMVQFPSLDHHVHSKLRTLKVIAVLVRA